MVGISALSSSTVMQGMGGMGGMGRPNAAKMAEELFSRLDTSGQGYIQKTDLQSAYDRVASSASGGSANAGNVDDLFAALDANSDGTVTKQELD